jgi:thiamine biosynthesis lipoprotein
MPSGGATRRELHDRYAAAHGLGSTSWPALGTVAHVLTTDPAALGAARRAVEAVLADIDHAASRFRDDSELCAVNAAAGSWVGISPLLFRAVRIALDAAEWSGGVVDPTVGATLIDLGYDRTYSAITVDGPRPVRVRPAGGWHRVDLDEDTRRIRVPAGALLDLGATAKGFAADLAADAAAEAAGCGVLINLGGDVSVTGAPPPAGWAVTVADRSDLDLPVGAEVEQKIVIQGGGLATSSVQARRWRRGGVALHHVIDPRAGRPSEGRYRTVSTVASTCTLANAASTAAIVLGDDAPSWLRGQGIPARLVDRSGQVQYVAGWPEPTGAAA